MWVIAATTVKEVEPVVLKRDRGYALEMEEE